MVLRITAACPVALMDDANHLAMCLAFSEADGNTCANPQWQDADGNLYAAASWEAREEWIAVAQGPLTRPEWDVGGIIDMDAANRAQAALVFSLTPVAASPTTLTALGGMDGLTALAAMGLTLVPADDA
jgi:hypothetical protein